MPATHEEIRAIRGSRRYKKLRAEFREYCSDQQFPCWLAGKPIDYEGATAVHLIGPGEASGSFREIAIKDGKIETVKFR